MKIFIVFCNTLYDLSYLKKKYNINLLNEFDIVNIIEHPCHFTKYNFGKTKLCYHTATMLEYRDYLLHNKITVEYINFYNFNAKIFYKKTNQYFCIDPLDKSLINELELNKVHIFENINFLLTYAEHINLYKTTKNINP